MNCKSSSAASDTLTRTEAIEPGKILYIDMDNVLADFPSGMAACDPALLEQHKESPDEIPGLFALMQPMPGAIAAYHELSELFDTYILSTAPRENPSALRTPRQERVHDTPGVGFHARTNASCRPWSMHSRFMTRTR